MAKAFPGRPWKPGRAADHNRLENAAEVVAASKLNLGGPDPKKRESDPLVMTVKNISGTAKRQYEVCQLRRTKVITDLLPDQTRFSGENPWQGGIAIGGNYNYLPRQFGVYLEPCAANDYARVQIAGVCPALVYMTANADNYCDVDFEEDRLISTVAGSIQIVQKPSTGTGEQLCLVNLSSQEECHLIGIPMGNGITAYDKLYGTPGTGVVRLYFQKDGAIYDVVENGGPAYLTVFSLHDDPIVGNTVNYYGGDTYTPGLSRTEYCLLHRDMYGTWWIDPMPHAKVALLHAVGNRADLQYPSDPTDYLILNTSLGSLENLDVDLLVAYGSPGYEQNGIAKLLLTGDYTVTLSWSGGLYYSTNAPAIASWGYLAFATITVTVECLPPGGAWTTLLSSAASRYTDGAGQYPDLTGGSYTTSKNLQVGTLLRCSAGISVQYPSGTPKLDTTTLLARLNVIKHA